MTPNSSPDPSGEAIRLRVRGTPFQLKIWEALLRIPYGATTTYGDIARAVPVCGFFGRAVSQVFNAQGAQKAGEARL